MRSVPVVGIISMLVVARNTTLDDAPRSGPAAMSDELDYITIRGFRSLRGREIGATSGECADWCERGWQIEFCGRVRLVARNPRRSLGGICQDSRRGDAALVWIQENQADRLGDIVPGSKERLSRLLARTQDDSLRTFDESVWYWEAGKYPDPKTVPLQPNGREAGISSKSVRQIPKYVRKHLARWRVYHFHDTSDLSPMKGQAQCMTTVTCVPTVRIWRRYCTHYRKRIQRPTD